MAVRTWDDIMELIKKRIGDSTTDEDIRFVEDIHDTIADYDRRVSGQEDWKLKYEQNDAEWRRKYTERFFSNDRASGDEAQAPRMDEGERDETTIKTYEDLFKEV